MKTKKFENEVWKDVKFFGEFPYWEGKYQVSNLGRIRSLFYKGTPRVTIKNVFILSGKPENPYYYTRFTAPTGYPDKWLRVHRLVAKAFIPIPKKYLKQGLTEKDLAVNHIDEDPSNNCVSNLEWTTTKENNAYGTRGKRISESLKKNTKHMKTLSKRFIRMNKEGCKPVAQYDITTGELLRTYASLTETRQFGFEPSCVGACCKGRSLRHKKFTWRWVVTKPRQKLTEDELLELRTIDRRAYLKGLETKAQRLKERKRVERGKRISQTLKNNEEFINRVRKQTASRNRAGAKAVGCYDLQTGELIKAYPVSSWVEQDGFDPGTVAGVCKGKYKHHKGYAWKYIPRVAITL